MYIIPLKHIWQMEHFGLRMFTCSKFLGVAHLKLLEKRRRDVTLSGERSNHAPGTDFEDRCAGQHRSCEAHVLRSDARLHGFSADILGKKYTQWRREIYYGPDIGSHFCGVFLKFAGLLLCLRNPPFQIFPGLRRDSKYVNLRWVLAAPGPISDSDIELASTCPEGQRVMILGFNTQVSPTAERTAKDSVGGRDEPRAFEPTTFLLCLTS